MPADHRNLNYPDNQRGWVLVVGLVILVMLTILSMALMKTTRLEEKMAGATRDMNLSFQAAESALRAAEIFIESKTDESDFNSLVVTNGIYSRTKDEPDNLFNPEVWIDPHSKAIDSALQGVASPPRYMIKKLIGCNPTVFRVTARGTGGPNNRATLLRSHYAKVFSTDSTLMGPAGCNEGIKLWLDADELYLFSDDSCAVKIHFTGEDVRCWKDRSNNDAHVTQTTVHKNDSCCPATSDPGATTHGVPQYQRDASTLNNKPYLLFNKNEEDALAHNLLTSWEDAHSLFLVAQLHTTQMKKYHSWFSNGLIRDAGSQFQVGCATRRCKHNRGWIAYSREGSTLRFLNYPHTDKTKIYTIRNDYNVSSAANETTTYINGEDTGHLETANLQKFTRYLIGLNRDANQWTNFRLAEMVLYDRALDNGELNDIHEYLATKYGISSGTESYPVGRLSWEQLFPD